MVSSSLTVSGWHSVLGLKDLVVPEPGATPHSADSGKSPDSDSHPRHDDFLVIRTSSGKVLYIDAEAVSRERLSTYGYQTWLAAEDLQRARGALQDLVHYHTQLSTRTIAQTATASCANSPESYCPDPRQLSGRRLSFSRVTELKEADVECRLLQLVVALCLHQGVEYAQGILHVLLRLCYLIPCPLQCLPSAFHLFNRFLSLSCPHLWFPRESSTNDDQCLPQKTLCLMFHQILQFHFPGVAFSIDRLFFTAYWNLHWFDSLGAGCFSSALVWLDVWYTLLALYVSRTVNDASSSGHVCNDGDHQGIVSNQDAPYRPQLKKTEDTQLCCPPGPYPEWMFFILAVVDHFSSQRLPNQRTLTATTGDHVAQLLCGLHGSDTAVPWDCVTLPTHDYLPQRPSDHSGTDVALTSHEYLFAKSPSCPSGAIFVKRRPWILSMLRLASRTPQSWLKRLTGIVHPSCGPQSQPLEEDKMSSYAVPVCSSELRHLHADTAKSETAFTLSRQPGAPSRGQTYNLSVDERESDLSAGGRVTEKQMLAFPTRFIACSAKEPYQRLAETSPPPCAQRSETLLIDNSTETMIIPAFLEFTWKQFFISDVGQPTPLDREIPDGGRRSDADHQKRRQVVLIVPIDHTPSTGYSLNTAEQANNFGVQRKLLLDMSPTVPASAENRFIIIYTPSDPQSSGGFPEYQKRYPKLGINSLLSSDTNSMSSSSQISDCFISDSLDTTIEALRAAETDELFSLFVVASPTFRPSRSTTTPTPVPRIPKDSNASLVKDGVIQITASTAKSTGKLSWYTYNPNPTNHGISVFLRLIESGLPYVAVCHDFLPSFDHLGSKSHIMDLQRTLFRTTLPDQVHQLPRRVLTSPLLFRRRVTQQPGARKPVTNQANTSNNATKNGASILKPTPVLSPPTPALAPHVTAVISQRDPGMSPPETSPHTKPPAAHSHAPCYNSIKQAPLGSFQIPLFTRRKTTRPKGFSPINAEPGPCSVAPSRSGAQRVSREPLKPSINAEQVSTNEKGVTVWHWFQSLFVQQPVEDGNSPAINGKKNMPHFSDDSGSTDVTTGTNVHTSPTPSSLSSLYAESECLESRQTTPESCLSDAPLNLRYRNKWKNARHRRLKHNSPSQKDSADFNNAKAHVSTTTSTTAKVSGTPLPVSSTRHPSSLDKPCRQPYEPAAQCGSRSASEPPPPKKLNISLATRRASLDDPHNTAILLQTSRAAVKHNVRWKAVPPLEASGSAIRVPSSTFADRNVVETVRNRQPCQATSCDKPQKARSTPFSSAPVSITERLVASLLPSKIAPSYTNCYSQDDHCHSIHRKNSRRFSTSPSNKMLTQLKTQKSSRGGVSSTLLNTLSENTGPSSALLETGISSSVVATGYHLLETSHRRSLQTTPVAELSRFTAFHVSARSSLYITQFPSADSLLDPTATTLLAGQPPTDVNRTSECLTTLNHGPLVASSAPPLTECKLHRRPRPHLSQGRTLVASLHRYSGKRLKKSADLLRPTSHVACVVRFTKRMHQKTSKA